MVIILSKQRTIIIIRITQNLNVNSQTYSDE